MKDNKLHKQARDLYNVLDGLSKQDDLTTDENINTFVEATQMLEGMPSKDEMISKLKTKTHKQIKKFIKVNKMIFEEALNAAK